MHKQGWVQSQRDLQPEQIRQSHCFTDKIAAIAVMNTTSESKQP